MKLYYTILTMLHSLNASASTDNYFICNYQVGLWKECKLMQNKLAEPIIYQGINYHTSYHIRYSFDCKGHETDLYFKSGSNREKIIMGSEQSEIVEGDQHLELFDPDPILTHELAFQPQCRLTISKIDVTPSGETIKLWKEEAKTQYYKIKDSISYYQLTKKLANIMFPASGLPTDRNELETTYDQFYAEDGLLANILEKYDLTLDDVLDRPQNTLKPLERMPQSWQNLVELHPILMSNLSVFLGNFNALYQNNQLHITKEEAYEKMIQAKNELLQEKQLGHQILDRAKFYSAEISSLLTNAIKDIDNILKN